MDILYLSSMYSEEIYNQIFNHFGKITSYASQKYNHMMVDGFIANGASVTALSVVVLPDYSDNSFALDTTERVDKSGVCYDYILTGERAKKISEAYNKITKWCKEHKNGVIVCDIIIGELSLALRLARPFIKNKAYAIVTDVPAERANKPKNLFRRFTANFIKNSLINGFDGYIFLTEQMNELLNKKDKPYVVVEGFVDTKMKDMENLIENKYPQKVCMFAGLLDKVFGIEVLVKAFIRAQPNGAELHIYGHGDYVEELKDICSKYSFIKYMGERVNSDIVKEELKATLMVNPRPSTDEYTKYSFPSKNMEYIVSGTPLLTTKLSGMPKEYYSYVYLIDDESIEGTARVLNEIMSKNETDLHNFGMDAKRWVLEEKNNVKQVIKILDIMGDC